MSEIQKIPDNELREFLTQEDLSQLPKRERYQLFKKLELPVQYAVKKVVKKFHSLPLEENDFMTIAWIAFEDVLKKYRRGRTRKSFVSYLIDAVYWKSLDYACSFINNRHRILNNLNYECQWVENSQINDDLSKRLTIKIIVEDYFQKIPHRELISAVFYDFLYQTSVEKIARKYQIARNQVRKILSKTISDLNKLLA